MKIICVGLNYQEHNIEMNRTPSGSDEPPVLFLKPDSAILTDDRSRFFIPDFSKEIHYEAEIVIKINKMGKNIAQRFAHRYYNELTIGIDFTARDIQGELKKKGLPWEISKGFDNSAALGTFISKDEIEGSLDDLEFRLDKNEHTVQAGNSSDMIHPVDEIIAYASRYFTLKTGDLIFTGTPAGVGKVEIGDSLQGFIQDKKLLDVQIC